MDPAAVLLVPLVAIGAGVAMGWINNVAGGAGIFAIWAFQYGYGLPISVANPSARVAAVAIGLFAFLGYLRAGRRPEPRAWLQALLAVPGAVLGSLLALELPGWAFRGYLAVLMALLLWQQLRRPRSAAPLGSPRSGFGRAAGCVLIGAHMGFAQIGTGLVATLVLARAYRRDLVAVNVAKSTIVILTSLASVSCFWLEDAIAWTPALVLAAGAAVGSYLGSHWSVARGSDAIRVVVVAIAAVTLVEQLVQIAA